MHRDRQRTNNIVILIVTDIVYATVEKAEKTTVTDPRNYILLHCFADILKCEFLYTRGTSFHQFCRLGLHTRGEDEQVKHIHLK